MTALQVALLGIQLLDFIVEAVKKPEKEEKRDKCLTMEGWDKRSKRGKTQKWYSLI